MNKSGLSFGDTRLIIPILLFFFILIFLKISLDKVSQEATIQIIEAQSQSIEKIFSLYKQHDEITSEIIVQTINDVSYISPAKLKIISPDSDILYDQTFDSIDTFAHLMTKTYEITVSDFSSASFLVICTYNFSKFPNKINSKTRFIFIITILILTLFLFIYGFIFYKKVNIQMQKKELISKNSLINIYNNQNFSDNIFREATRMKRTGGTLSVICIALDDLDENASDKIADMKKMMYNSAIQIIIDNVRIFDMIGKFDNDNRIYICMIDATENDGYNVAKRFSQKIFESKFYLDGHEEITTTICAGVASFTIYKDTETQPSNITEQNITDLISHSIQAYRNASEIGKNSVVKYSTIANK